MKVGFVYVTPLGEAGWTHQHNEARLEMEKTLAGQVHTSYVENVQEGADAQRVIREMAASGHKLIFATSFGYMNPMLQVAREFPEVVFMHATGYKTAKNMGAYNARFYEGRYLNGLIAGKMTKSNLLGYVAAFPIPEVLQGINAFTLGARRVNPKAKVRVIWIHSWLDPGKQRQAANTLISQGADVLSHHSDSPSVVQAAADRGKYVLGYHSDMSRYAPNAHLSATIHEWGRYYTDVTSAVLKGQWKNEMVWGGVADGMIRIAPMNKAVPKATRALVDKLAAKIKNGSFHPFTGPIKDQTGKQILATGKVMDDATLNRMDYYVQGVESRLPK